MSTIEAGVERVASRIETSRRSESSTQESSQQEQVQAEQQQVQEVSDRAEISQASRERLEQAQR
jgi:hypothetical protein